MSHCDIVRKRNTLDAVMQHLFVFHWLGITKGIRCIKDFKAASPKCYPRDTTWGPSLSQHMQTVEITPIKQNQGDY